MKIRFMVFITTLMLSASSCAQIPHENQTDRYFEAIKTNPQRLTPFLYHLPKGGDLHNHESGATYAENLLNYAKHDNLCVNRITYTIFADAKCEQNNLLNNAIKNPEFKNALIDNWSMRDFDSKKESGHDHFFSTFSKYGLIVDRHRGEVLSEIMERAAQQNEQYLELMVTADGNASGKLGKKSGWDPDFTQMRDKLLHADFDRILKNISANLDEDEAKMRALLACDSMHPKAGCHVKVRYLYQVLREQAPEMVFAQLLAGFEAASKDKRVVGLNMVQPEDGKISMRDYKLHMQMVGFLHQLYPHVLISLHAGELNHTLVPPEGLTFHIHDAVTIAHANRIGHGVDIESEDNADQLLREMAAKKVMVEINLTSNAYILNVEGKNHPLPLYMRYGVPVTLSTDDEGVSRSNLTKEYLRAVTTYQLHYKTVKNLVRNSLTYSFLPGKSLWEDDSYHQAVPACSKERLGSLKPSKTCQAFLNTSEKARLQWDLEKRFIKFEKWYC
jgi:adenosine deaminase